jgi:hypothetical protein
MDRWFGLAGAQEAMGHLDTAHASQAAMGRWFGSERVAQATTARWFGLARVQRALARSDSREDVTPEGAADHRGSWQREDQQAHR